MRIGIDTTALPPKPVGAGNYIINLTRWLVSLKADYDFVIFVQKSRVSLLNLPKNKNTQLRVVPDMHPVKRLIWEQTLLPRLVRHSGLDGLHSLHYTVPLTKPCRSVVTFHDMTFFLFPQLHTLSKRFFFRVMIRASSRRADAMVAVSESTRRDSIRILDIPSEKIIAIPLGVGENFRKISDEKQLEDIRRKYNLPEKFILYVGLVEPRKNLALLLKAYCDLQNQGFPHALVIVGRYGWGYEAVLKQVQELKLKQWVHFTGYVEHSELPAIYNLASLMVYPSFYEGFGLPVLEAMASGTPLVTTEVSSMPELVGGAGLLFPPGDKEALVEAMRSVLSDKEFGDHLSSLGLQQAARFTWRQTATETLQVYNSIFS
jgi:glycosyltransferase involved in cell wall biosynthesis